MNDKIEIGPHNYFPVIAKDLENGIFEIYQKKNKVLLPEEYRNTKLYERALASYGEKNEDALYMVVLKKRNYDPPYGFIGELIPKYQAESFLRMKSSIRRDHFKEDNLDYPKLLKETEKKYIAACEEVKKIEDEIEAIKKELEKYSVRLLAADRTKQEIKQKHDRLLNKYSELMDENIQKQKKEKQEEYEKSCRYYKSIFDVLKKVRSIPQQQRLDEVHDRRI